MRGNREAKALFVSSMALIFDFKSAQCEGGVCVCVCEKKRAKALKRRVKQMASLSLLIFGVGKGFWVANYSKGKAQAKID